VLHGKPHMALALGGAAVVVVVALVKKSSGSAAGTSTTSTGPASQTPSYDSTSNDVYNSIESQLTAFQNQLTQLSNTMPSGSGASTSGGAVTPPVAAPPTSPLGAPPKATIPTGGGPHLPTGKPIRRGLFSTVTVQRNQTLGGIAASHHESLQTLLADNPVYRTNSRYRGGNRIFAGDKVKVR
jgi:LysM repeat protein